MCAPHTTGSDCLTSRSVATTHHHHALLACIILSALTSPSRRSLSGRTGWTPGYCIAEFPGTVVRGIDITLVRHIGDTYRTSGRTGRDGLSLPE